MVDFFFPVGAARVLPFYGTQPVASLPLGVPPFFSLPSVVSIQLKTWDFVELSQQEPYGDINVTAGVRERRSQFVRSVL